ncbi:MAG: NUDIX domain-containing protein [Pseudonocardia sp.]|nr:NUDIX domain-containing protein [Pseudonocardia sp.]
MIKHATSSVFVFCQLMGRWRLGLIEHPRLGRHMLVGGHVEADETQAEAAVRETVEESGLHVRLLELPAPFLPAGYPHPQVPAPWWITEMMVPADNHLAEPHVHVDHQYVAVAESSMPVSEPVHPFAWFDADELAGLAMFEDTRLLAHELFPRIMALTSTNAPRRVDVLAALAG